MSLSAPQQPSGVMKPVKYFLHTCLRNECFHNDTVCIMSTVSAVVLYLCSIMSVLLVGVGAFVHVFLFLGICSHAAVLRLLLRFRLFSVMFAMHGELQASIINMTCMSYILQFLIIP